MKEKLKNQEEVFIRPIRRGDEALRHRFWVELCLDQRGIINNADEIDYHVSESEAKIADFIIYRRGLWLVAENAQHEIVGEIDILVKPYARIKHVGQLTIGVQPSYQGFGLASLLMKKALAWAEKQGLKRIELFVFSSNEAALALYKKFGFVIEGRRKNYLRHSDNFFEDDLLLALYL